MTTKLSGWRLSWCHGSFERISPMMKHKNNKTKKFLVPVLPVWRRISPLIFLLVLMCMLRAMYVAHMLDSTIQQPSLHTQERMLHEFTATISTSWKEGTVTTELNGLIDNNGDNSTMRHKSHDQHSDNSSSPLTNSTNKTEAIGIGACLMFKDDNVLLQEWIAYHYTVLPLRYLVIGIDVGNQEDPNDVLRRWTNLDLHFVILNANEFDSFSGTPTEPSVVKSPTKQQQESKKRTKSTLMDPSAMDAHHRLINRQKTFLRKCTLLMKQTDLWNHVVTWTTYIDSDEFVTWNTLNVQEEEQEQLRVAMASKKKDGDMDAVERECVDNRKRHVPQVDDNKQLGQTSRMTILEFLQQNREILVQDNYNRTICYTLPRLRFGARQNHSCRHRLSHGAYHQLNTLQFFQHANKGDFSANKFGKVMMDVSQISQFEMEVQDSIRNIHRPLLHYCGPGAKPLRRSLLRLNHYLGSWERYSCRNQDARRSKAYWEQIMPSLDKGQSCQDVTHHWLTWFVDQVGREKAMFLLNMTL